MNSTTRAFPDDAVRSITELLGESAVAQSHQSRTTATGSSLSSGHISVVHVDPSESHDLTAVEPFSGAGVSVQRVSCAEEAIHLFDVADCIISEYDLPEASGCELLDLVREECADLPFIFFTNSDLNRIPGERLRDWQTDYVQKTASRRHERLANRLSALLSLSRMWSQSQQDHQYVEQVRNLFDFALDTATLYLWNWNLEEGTVTRYPRTEQLFGLDKRALEPVFGGFTEYVHPDHRDEVVTTLERAIEDESSYRLQYALELPGPRQVWIEERGTVLDSDGTATRAVGVSIDITEQKERERELTWERELNRTLHAALVESRTRAELEQTVVTQLHDYGYELAWIGDLLVDEIKPRATAGRDAYLTDVDLSLPSERHSTEPVFKAIDERTGQFVDELDAGPHTAWRETAIEAGFRSEAAVPLVYHDVFYGVIGVYAGEAAVFDQTARRLLSALADTLAFVIHNIERKDALASNRIISATLQVVGTRYYLKEIIASADCETGDTRLLVHETLPYDDDRTMQYVSVTGTSVESIVDAAVDHPVVDDVTTIGVEPNRRIQIQHRGQTPESELTTVGTRVRSTSVTEDRADILIEVPNKFALRTAIETLDTSNGHISLLSSIERDLGPDLEMDPLAELTDRQATVLRAAYHQGYFEQPRESSAKDVAQSLGITHPTLLEHLRIAQQKVFHEKFE